MLDLSTPIAAITSLILAATDEPGFFGSLLTNIWLWGRVALGIGMVIFVHELGHFVAAKCFGVKCEKFYVGFDVPIKIGPIKFPRTLGKFTYGETEYGIGIIPLGGYVKMLGQDDDPRRMQEEKERIQEEGGDPDTVPELDPRSFPAKPVWQRMIIISAGVIVNVITGVLFAAIAYGFGVSQIPAFVGGVTPGGAAWRAGIEPGGKVVAVKGFRDEKMPFREMVIEIMKQSVAEPGQSIGVTIEYNDGERKFDLIPEQVPDGKRMRPMIGIGMPNSVRLTKKRYASKESVADDVLTKADAQAFIVGYNGNQIAIGSNAPGENTPGEKSPGPDAPDQNIPGVEFFDYLFTHPTKSIDLTLRRQDQSTHKVTLPPQLMRTLGLEFEAGAIEGLVEKGPAKAAGMKVGDRLLSIDGKPIGGAMRLAVRLAELQGSHKFKLQRGEEEIELEIEPGKMLQAIPPMIALSKLVAINRFGFAFPVTSVVKSIDSSSIQSLGDETLLGTGDQIKEIRLMTKTKDLAEHLQDPKLADTIKRLHKGWAINETNSLIMLIASLQRFSEGTEFSIYAERAESTTVVAAIGTVQQSKDLYAFDRGLNFPAREKIRIADSFGEALSLGVKEGKRRFGEVLEFLKLISQGKVGLSDVGGPLMIANIAKQETKRGVSNQLLFLTMLSMNLAILNFLPIPALDGGHMVFLTYELIRGKRANEELEFRLTVAGVLSLLALMVVVFASDLMKMFGS